MERFLRIALLLFLLLLSSCANDHIANSPKSEMMFERGSVASFDTKNFTPEYSEDVAAKEDGAKIQVNGHLYIEVDEVNVVVSQVNELIRSLDGRVTNSNSGGGDRSYTNMTILVPAISFYPFIDEIKKISNSVTGETIFSNDVTEQYIDVNARLNVMKKTEQRFLTLLLKTEEIEEVIQVERELMRIRGEIDSLDGRLNYLSKTTENSVLTLSITEAVPISGTQWDIMNSLENSLRNLVSFSKHIVDFLITLMVFSPFIIISAGVIYLLYRVFARFLWNKGP